MHLDCLDLAEFHRTPRLLLMDLELTCWEDNGLRNHWPDGRRPPEVLEIGIALYAVDEERVLSTFGSIVKPRLNPTLSDFCVGLTRLTQAEVDAAPSLAEAVRLMDAWLATVDAGGVPTCSWCTLDRHWLHDDARRVGCIDPLEGRRHANVSSLLLQALGEPGDVVPPRDAMTSRLGLPPISNRHRALSDAVDLGRFCALLRRIGAREVPQC